MKSYAGNVNIVNNNDLENRILNVLLLLLGVLILCYVLFLGNIIFNIIERKSLEADARSLMNEVGKLESEYLAVSNKVDLNLASTLGFREVEKQYAIANRQLGSIKFVKNEL